MVCEAQCAWRNLGSFLPVEQLKQLRLFGCIGLYIILAAYSPLPSCSGLGLAAAMPDNVDFISTPSSTPITPSWWLKFGISLLGLSLSIACYCILYLEWFRKLPDYDAYNPYLVPISTASFITGGFW